MEGVFVSAAKEDSFSPELLREATSSSVLWQRFPPHYWRML